MSAVQSMVVFGHVYFLGLLPNNFSTVNQSLIQPTTTSTEIPIVTESVIQLTSATTTAPILPPGYTYTPGIGAHKAYKIGRNWNDARSYCEDQGAHLIIINSFAKMEAIAKLINNSQITAGWIGAHDLYKEGQFVTIHGESLPTGFAGWHSGNPDNTGGDENCVIVTTSGRLDDRQCTQIYPFTCELHL